MKPSGRTAGATFIIVVLTILSLLLLGVGALVILHSSEGLAFLAAAVLVAVFARLVQASRHHLELMDAMSRGRDA